jgi:hypothetical protein
MFLGYPRAVSFTAGSLISKALGGETPYWYKSLIQGGYGL